EIELARLAQEAEQEQLGDWKERENSFHLSQAKKRAEIRASLNRPKPIDILAINLKLATSNIDDPDQTFDYNIDFTEPWKIVEALMLVCDSRRQRLKEIDSSTGVSKAVEQEIITFLNKKSKEDLDIIESEIQQKFQSNLPIDSDYWEQVLKQMVVEKAKLKIDEYHNKVISNLLTQTRRKQLDDAAKHQHELALYLSNPANSIPLVAPNESIQDNDIIDNSTADDADNQQTEKAVEEFTSDMVPVLLKDLGREDRNLDIYSQDEFNQILLKKRLQILKFEFITKKSNQNSSDSNQELSPRKPRYFNRVHTGYEWNKYNQTHYDFDNPPPKVVMGYKFNIFYPDLIDKSKAPTYRIEQDPDLIPETGQDVSRGHKKSRRITGDTCIIRFIAGPPYEDIAFKIVNKEWEYGRKFGFKNSFDRNVLQLHFKFARQFYRK
ncbi:Cactin, partial [Smittium culicis]